MDKLTEEKHSMENHRTAKLWLQYMEMIGILRMFIKAERTGDWAGTYKLSKQCIRCAYSSDSCVAKEEGLSCKQGK